MNCHFVTESLQKRWEWKPGSLRYYDFPTGKIRLGRTKRLFAKTDTNSAEIEGLFNELIERPLSALIPALLSGRVEMNFSLYRACYLYFLCQFQRYIKANDLQEFSVPEHDLDRALKNGATFLDGLVGLAMKDYELLRVVMSKGRDLFLSEIGAFPVAFSDQECSSGFTTGFALPIDPRAVLVLAPRTANKEVCEGTKYKFQQFSVGLPPQTNRVIIPPVLLEQLGSNRVIELCEAYRKGNTELFGWIDELRTKTIELNRIQGLDVCPTVPGCQRALETAVYVVQDINRGFKRALTPGLAIVRPK